MQQYTDKVPRQPSDTEAQPLMEVEGPPPGLETAHSVLFSPSAVTFTAELVAAFEQQVDELQIQRLARKCQVRQSTWLPTFQEELPGDWRVAALPPRLQNRRLDLGDVSPAHEDHLVRALQAPVQGVQVDFDDGHCPTWRNQLAGLYNVYRCVHGLVPGLSSVDQLPVLMMRPRAWNMVEDHVMVNGRKVAGPLFDFALLMFHVARALARCGSGPFLYLSKLESAEEARLWDRVFTWSEHRLELPHGTIKACVLVENILTTFQLDAMLHALREHSLGLNCGVWDYAASIICKFGERRQFLLPDRGKYISLERRFLRKYLQLVVSTSHRRGAPATGGMAALLLPPAGQHPHRHAEVVRKVKEAKRLEILEGVDGFLVYDVALVPYMTELWSEVEPPSALGQAHVSVGDLLAMPHGGVTEAGLRHNIAVAVLFVCHWLRGKGHFSLGGAVEDSATAEISRSQVWQWIRHGAKMEDSNVKVTKSLVQDLVQQFVKNQHLDARDRDDEPDVHRLTTAADIFLDIVTKRDFPEFITTYLYEHHAFQSCHRE